MLRTLLLLFLAFRAVAQTHPAGEVTFFVRVSPPNPVAGDEVRLELEVTAPKQVSIELPDNPGVIDCAEVTERDPPSSIADKGRVIHREAFVLDPAGPGMCHIPALAVRYGSATLASHEIVFQIASLIPPGETAPDIRDGQTPLSRPEVHIQWWFIAPAAAMLLAVLAWFTFSGRKPAARPAAQEPAEAVARRRLARLAQSAPPVPREFYSQLSRILTAYLDERLSLRSTRCTSPEMVQAVQRTGLLTQTGRNLLEALLEDCDYAKFSPECPVGDSPEEAVDCCRKIIDLLCAQAASRSRLAHSEGELTRA
jgi:hypothetical protein